MRYYSYKNNFSNESNTSNSHWNYYNSKWNWNKKNSIPNILPPSGDDIPGFFCQKYINNNITSDYECFEQKPENDTLTKENYNTYMKDMFEKYLSDNDDNQFEEIDISKIPTNIQNFDNFFEITREPTGSPVSL